jgi:deoxyadenosine/deoxycytidine kinase
MTNKDIFSEVIILCEDIDHKRFITQYLVERGLDKRKIKKPSNLKAGEVSNNNSSVVEQYPNYVKQYRQKRNQKNVALIIMIDGDYKTFHQRIRSLNKALDEREGELNKELRQPDEKIAIFVPTRNIETWFEYVNGNNNCNEQDDYKNKNLDKKERVKLAKDSATKLAKEICPQGLPPDAPPSLLHACQELERLQLD